MRSALSPRIRRWATAIAAALAVVVVVVVSGFAARRATFFDDTRFSVLRWEMTTLPNKWLYLLGSALRDDPADSTALRQYFTSAREIARLEREIGDRPDPAQAARLDSLRDERRSTENHIERIIEGRLTSVLSHEGLKSSPPLLPFSLIWPPVDFEPTGAPRVLATSPRDRIELLSSDLLNTGLTPEEAFALERKAERGGRSAIVLETSGVATYPSIVGETDSYEDMVEAAAHEWVHQHLAFHPLGRRYFGDLRDVNETVATIAGRDIARLVLERYPSPELPPAVGAPASTPGPTVDVRAYLGELRREVDDLLAKRKVQEAEALMEERRQWLEGQGVFIRKINQAYFAFRGLYATSGTAAGDLGPRLESLRQQTGSVGAFIRAVRGVTSRSDLERLIPPAP